MGRIAVVDDAADILELFEVILTGEHEIRTFTDAQTFLATCGRERFDLIVLDIVMPEFDGYQVLQKIREHDSAVPVIATTAKAQPVERARALRAGFCEYFTKPIVDIDHFRKIILGRAASG